MRSSDTMTTQEKSFLCFYVLFGTLTTASAATLHVPGFNEVNQFSLPAGVPSPLGDVLFSPDGNTLLILGGSEFASSGVWSVPVTRDASGTVIGLGAATAFFATPGMDTSLEFKPGTGTLFFRMTAGRVGEKRPDGTIATFTAEGASFTGGLAFVPNPLPNAGDLLVGNWSSGLINSHSLTDNSDGTFTPVLQGFYSNSQSGATGDFHFIPTGAFANDLMFTNWSNGTVSIIDIDPATGLPVGGGSTPSITLFASGLGGGPWGLHFDAISGNLFISNWGGIPSNGIVQVSGFPAPSISIFTADVEIELGPEPNNDEFEVEGSFTLAVASNGIDPLTEDVTIRVGTFSTTIPAGSFEVDDESDDDSDDEEFEFEGVIDGVELEFEIEAFGDDSFDFEVEGEDADLTGTVNPVEVTLTIGDDTGTISVTAEIEVDDDDDSDDESDDDDDSSSDSSSDDSSSSDSTSDDSAIDDSVSDASSSGGTAGDIGGDREAPVLSIPDDVASCPKDINHDGVINVLDLIDLFLCFGRTAAPACQAEDVNDDLAVNVLDIIDLLLDFGAECP